MAGDRDEGPHRRGDPPGRAAGHVRHVARMRLVEADGVERPGDRIAHRSPAVALGARRGHVGDVRVLGRQLGAERHGARDADVLPLDREHERVPALGEQPEHGLEVLRRRRGRQDPEQRPRRGGAVRGGGLRHRGHGTNAGHGTSWRAARAAATTDCRTTAASSRSATATIRVPAGGQDGRALAQPGRRRQAEAEHEAALDAVAHAIRGVVVAQLVDAPAGHADVPAQGPARPRHPPPVAQRERQAEVGQRDAQPAGAPEAGGAGPPQDVDEQQRAGVLQPPRPRGVPGCRVEEERPPLAVEVGEPAEAPPPQHLRRLDELAPQRDLAEQEAVGDEHRSVHAAERVQDPGPEQPVDHVPGHHAAEGGRHARERLPDAARLGPPRRARRVVGPAVLVDALGLRIGEHGLGVLVEQRDEALEPRRAPHVVVRAERPELGLRVALAGEREGAARVAEHPEPPRVHVHLDAGVLRGERRGTAPGCRPSSRRRSAAGRGRRGSGRGASAPPPRGTAPC